MPTPISSHVKVRVRPRTQVQSKASAGTTPTAVEQQQGRLHVSNSTFAWLLITLSLLLCVVTACNAILSFHLHSTGYKPHATFETWMKDSKEVSRRLLSKVYKGNNTSKILTEDDLKSLLDDDSHEKRDESVQEKNYFRKTGVRHKGADLGNSHQHPSQTSGGSKNDSHKKNGIKRDISETDGKKRVATKHLGSTTDAEGVMYKDLDGGDRDGVTLEKLVVAAKRKSGNGSDRLRGSSQKEEDEDEDEEEEKEKARDNRQRPGKGERKGEVVNEVDELFSNSGQSQGKRQQRHTPVEDFERSDDDSRPAEPSRGGDGDGDVFSEDDEGKGRGREKQEEQRQGRDQPSKQHDSKEDSFDDDDDFTDDAQTHIGSHRFDAADPFSIDDE